MLSWTNFLSAGVQQNLNIEIYNQGSISVMENNCLSQANYESSPGAGACKYNNDQVILLGGNDKRLFLIHEISTSLCQRKEGK